MREAAADPRSAVASALPVLRAMDASATAISAAPGKWSARELVGHLIDSASNNHQRFVRARFQDDLVFAGYEQDAWVAAQRYAAAPWDELVELWALFNLHLARVFESTPATIATRSLTRHNFDAIAFRPVLAGRPATLAYFARD